MKSAGAFSVCLFGVLFLEEVGGGFTYLDIYEFHNSTKQNDHGQRPSLLAAVLNNILRYSTMIQKKFLKVTTKYFL